MRSYCRDPGEILSLRSLHDLVQLFEKHPEKILADLEDVLHWFLYERSSGMFIGSSCMKIFFDDPL